MTTVLIIVVIVLVGSAIWGWRGTRQWSDYAPHHGRAVCGDASTNPFCRIQDT